MEERMQGTNGKLKRREAREQAFQILFEKTVNDEPMRELMEAAEEAWEMQIDAYASRILLLTEEKQEEIDERIAKHLRGWNLRRLSKVTLSLLRLAVCEMCFLQQEDVPVSVSINEAVELAKRYGNEKDASYINGVLASVARAEDGAGNA